MNIAIIIPARYNSQRFPGKPLELLKDRTILEHVYYNCLQVDLASKVVIATDDDRIAKLCEEKYLDYVMTSPDHASGTDRIAEAVEKLNMKASYIINVQGDEPFVQAKDLNILAQLMISREVEIATLYKTKDADLIKYSPNEVKVTMNLKGEALYFSRSPIPFFRHNNMGTRKIHIGTYGFKREVLLEITKLPPSELELAERLEQLRWLENGYKIHLAKSNYNGFGIDTPEDLERARKLFES